MTQMGAGLTEKALIQRWLNQGFAFVSGYREDGSGWTWVPQVWQKLA